MKDMTDTSDSMAQPKQWSKTEIITLIKILRSKPEFWAHPKNSVLADRPLKNATIHEAAAALDTTTDEVRRKWHNLRTQFLRENNKMKEYFSSNPVPGVSWKSNWLYFDHMEFIVQEYQDNLNDSEEFISEIKPELSHEEETDFVDNNADNQVDGLFDKIEHKPQEIRQKCGKRPRKSDNDWTPTTLIRKNSKRHADATVATVAPSRSWGSTQSRSMGPQEPWCLEYNQEIYQEDVYEQFGKYVAAQMRTMSPRAAANLQLEIQNAITKALINVMPSELS